MCVWYVWRLLQHVGSFWSLHGCRVSCDSTWETCVSVWTVYVYLPALISYLDRHTVTNAHKNWHFFFKERGVTLSGSNIFSVVWQIKALCFLHCGFSNIWTMLSSFYQSTICQLHLIGVCECVFVWRKKDGKRGKGHKTMVVNYAPLLSFIHWSLLRLCWHWICSTLSQVISSPFASVRLSYCFSPH